MRKLMPGSLQAAKNKVQEVRRLIAAGSGEGAFHALEDANREFGGSQLRLGMYYIFGRLKEEGVLGGMDDEGALEDFTFLTQHESAFRAEGFAGSARVLYRKDPEKNADEVVALCKQAIHFGENVSAMMLMGIVFEFQKSDFKSARRWYLRAYRRGQLWGLRFYVAMQFKKRRFIRFALASALLAVTSPFIIKIYGENEPFKS